MPGSPSGMLQPAAVFSKLKIGDPTPNAIETRNVKLTRSSLGTLQRHTLRDCSAGLAAKGGLAHCGTGRKTSGGALLGGTKSRQRAVEGLETLMVPRARTRGIGVSVVQPQRHRPASLLAPSSIAAGAV